ncbi:hypothetical protein ACFWMR_12135 [Amycolatopsis thailandensis]|uniref:hypothetical protein n=1 Tax=Amycolatopsis thailandensis TaxID=589330 RepID=UPI003649135C
MLLSTITKEHRIRADVIRELLMGRHGQLDPHGVRVRGASIVGKLDLDGIDTAVGLELTGCSFTEAITARGAHLSRLRLAASRIGALEAEGLRLDGDMDLDRVRLTGQNATIWLYDARIGGTLRCQWMHADYSKTPALAADRLQVDGSVLLRGARFTGSGQRGAVVMLGARIGSQFAAEGMHATNSNGPALNVDGLQVDAGVFLTDARFTGSGQRGAVVLLNAHIGNAFHASRVHVTNSNGPALNADGLQVDASMLMKDAWLTGGDERGAVSLLGAHISGQLNVCLAHVTNSNGPALNADTLRVDASMLMRGARFTGSGQRGAVVLLNARIGSQFAAEGMHATNSNGPALSNDGLQVNDNMFLTDAWFIGSGQRGAVVLLGARIGSQLVAVGMHATNSNGPALNADSMQVDDTIALVDARFTGSGRHSALILSSTRVGNRLDFTGTRVSGGATRGITLRDARVAGAVIFRAELVCSQPWGRSCPRARRIHLSGFTFAELANTDWREWLHLIRFHTTHYSPSPYQQLAAAERAAGHDGNARLILIAQQQDLHRRAQDGLGGRLTRSFHKLWGLLGGYGYRARRTAAALLIVLAAAGGLGLWAGHVETNPGYAAERTTASGSPGQQCTPIELIGLGLDRGLPLAPTGLRARCDLDTTNTPGQVFTVAVWIIQAAIWGLATLALAGYTGLVRKPA